MLKIEHIEVEKLKIPLLKPFITALRRVENVEFVRVCIVFNDGTSSYGEAPATKAITGEDLDDIFNSINTIKDMLYSLKPLDALELLHKQKIGSSAKAAVDMALFFKINQFEYEDKSVIKTDITISLNEDFIMLEDAKQAYDNGYDILKIKLANNIKHAVKVTKEITKELPDAKILIDANQAWSVNDTLEYLNAVNDLNISLIEQPVIADDLLGLKYITEVSNIPILADESAFNLEDVKKIYENSFADMINIKLMKCGGVTKAVEILEYARKNKIVCMLGSMLEGPISINAAYKLAFAYRDVIKYIDLDSPLLYADKLSAIQEFEIYKNQIRFKS